MTQARPILHVAIPRDLKKKLDEMATKDRRGNSDFVRLLIEDEWQRRNSAAAEGNGAQQ